MGAGSAVGEAEVVGSVVEAVEGMAAVEEVGIVAAMVVATELRETRGSRSTLMVVAVFLIGGWLMGGCASVCIVVLVAFLCALQLRSLRCVDIYDLPCLW